MEKKTTLNYLLLAIQNALLEIVTPFLRAITSNLDYEKKIFYINFYYEGNISEIIKDLWECATTEISADLEGNFFTKCKIEKIDYPQEIPNNGILVYYRKEPQVLANIKKTEELIKCDYSEKELFSAKIRCAMQKVMLGHITPNIRQISIEWDEKFIYLHFYYHGEISNEDKQNMHELAKKLFSYFPHCYIHLRYFTVNEPIPLPIHKELIYLRYEKNYGHEALFKPLSN